MELCLSEPDFQQWLSLLDVTYVYLSEFIVKINSDFPAYWFQYDDLYWCVNTGEDI